MTIFLGTVRDLAGIVFDAIVFSIHFMFAEIFHFNGTESTKPGMKRYFSKTDTFYLESFDQFTAEVQAGSRSCHGAFMFGIYRLVALFIFFVRFTLDIFRKWCFSQFFQLFTETFFAAFPEKTDRTSAAG